MDRYSDESARNLSWSSGETLRQISMFPQTASFSQAENPRCFQDTFQQVKLIEAYGKHLSTGAFRPPNDSIGPHPDSGCSI